MSESIRVHGIDLEELADLGTEDLCAVFGEVEPEQVVLALSDVEPSLRQRLLAKSRLAHAHLSPTDAPAPDQVRSARDAVIDALCRMSRVGQIAFDHPDDILDQVA